MAMILLDRYGVSVKIAWWWRSSLG